MNAASTTCGVDTTADGETWKAEAGTVNEAKPTAIIAANAKTMFFKGFLLCERKRLNRTLPPPTWRRPMNLG